MATDRDRRGKKLLGAEVPAETYREFQDMAHDRRTSVSSLLRDAIDDKLDEYDESARRPEPQEI